MLRAAHDTRAMRRVRAVEESAKGDAAVGDVSARDGEGEGEGRLRDEGGGGGGGERADQDVRRDDGAIDVRGGGVRALETVSSRDSRRRSE